MAQPWYIRAPKVSVTPSSTPSETSGGTAHILNEERKKASFQSQKLAEFLYGGADEFKQYKIWKNLWVQNPLFDKKNDHFLSRPEIFEKSIARALESVKILRANPDLLQVHMPGGKGISMVGLSGNYCGLSDHFALFVGTLYYQSTPEQAREWLQPAMKLKIIGTYGQTELGHGSNIRGLETTAEYDGKTEEFILNSPTLTSLKWWPGALGVIATHAIMYARLIIEGKDYGFNSFVVQLRDENHKPLPGVEVGDIGPKIGYATNDSGFCRLTNVRIPRFNMLAKFQQVTKEGKYIKPPGGLDKIAYLTMTRARVVIVSGAFEALARAATIAIRYNAIRKQGFNNSKKGISSGESTILDYQTQQYTIFTQVATAFAIFFASHSLLKLINDFDESLKKKTDAANILPELHANSAGLKAYSTLFSTEGLELLRRSTGGQGYAMSSGIAAILLEYIPSVTYEGDRIPMALQLARFLIKSAEFAVSGKQSPVKYLSESLESSPPLSKLEDYRNLDKLREILKYRAQTAIFRAAQGLQENISKGISGEKAWNLTHNLLLNASETHIVYTLLDNFIEGIAQSKKYDKNTGIVLEKLGVLFALYRIFDRSIALDWVGYLTQEHTENIIKTINQLLTELRPDAVALADGFGFVDHDLNSCIGKEDGNVYEAVYEWAKKSPLNDPEWQHGLWERQLKPVLDKEILQQGKTKQRSKL